MQVSNKRAWKDWQEIGNRKVVGLAKRWAELMEVELRQGKTVKQVAEATMRKANTANLRLVQRVEAAQILVSCWKHGNELRRTIGL